MGLFRRRGSRDAATLARERYARAMDGAPAALADAAAGTASGDRRTATNAFYAIGEWHTEAFTGACEGACYDAKVPLPPEPFVDIDRAELIFGEDREREYEASLRDLAHRLGLDPDAAVAADERRQRYVESQGLRRDISGLLGRLGGLDREEAGLFASLVLERAQRLREEARELGEDPLLGPELSELVRATDELRTRAMAHGVPLEHPPR